MDFTGGREKPAQASPGIHSAVCVGIWDLGMQLATGQFAGKPPSPKVLIGWETQSGEFVNCEYTRQINEWKDKTTGALQSTKLKKHLESWFAPNKIKDPSKFDAKGLLGQHCQLVIAHSASGYARVDAITRPDGSKMNWQPVREFMYYEIGDEIPSGTENWIINRINARVIEGEEPQHSPPTENQAAPQAAPGGKSVPF